MREMNDNEKLIAERKREVIKVVRAIAKEFNLEIGDITFIRNDFYMGRSLPNGDIEIKVEFSDGEPVNEIELWRTVAHESAHAKFPNHEEEFWLFNREIALYMMREFNIKVKPEIALFDVARRGAKGVIS